MSKHLRMEEKIKNFDRGIEQMMNESTIAPPFGMWNRISAELDAAEALPVAAAAPASLVSKRVVYGFIVVAALIGTSMLTALWMNHSTKTVNQPITGNIPVAVVSETEKPAVASVVEVVAEPQMKPVAVLHSTKHIGKAGEEINGNPVVVEEQAAEKSITAINTEVAVPNVSSSANGQATDVYYFPPVDMSSVESKKETIAEETHNVVVEEKPIEKKIKSVSSSSNDKRISIKKRKRGGFTYGSLNRLKKQKPKY